MGIDIYLDWDGMTEADKQARYVGGYDITIGNTGYLREAYHGSPYATQYLLQEAFQSGNGEAHIPANILRERLFDAVRLHIKRHKELYNEDINFESPSAESIICFVELAERLEKAGKNPKVIASY